MAKQILIINITRMGDLVQTGALLGRLQHEWPGAAVDLVVDTSFAPMALMLSGVRQVLAYDFQELIDRSRAQASDVVQLFRRMAAWAEPLAKAGYDRVINLTFNRRSAFLAAYVGAPDVRGATAAPDGTMVIRGPWMSYFTDLHRYRRFNRFNIVDLYALGGSGPGPFAPLALTVDPGVAEWAKERLAEQGNTQTAKGKIACWIALQVGASDVMKAWRPHCFGQAMAAMAQRLPGIGFVLIGTPSEAPAVHEALAAYRASSVSSASARAPICDAVGATSLPELLALLAQCRLLLTNDTGPMHLAVSVGTPVVDLSVGHVDFRETGPYGPGHLVVQPDLACAPCGFDRVCPHQGCKDRVLVEEVADLCLYALGAGPCPSRMTGVRLYESEVDADGLGTYRLKAGREDPLDAWYGAFWRRFWYEALTGRSSRVPPAAESAELPPDVAEAGPVLGRLRAMMPLLVQLAGQVARLSGRRPLPAAELKAAYARLGCNARTALALGLSSPLTSPVTVAFVRDKENADAVGVTALTQQQAAAYQRWASRLSDVAGRLPLARQRAVNSS